MKLLPALVAFLVAVQLAGRGAAIVNDAVPETRSQCEARFQRRLAGDSGARRSTTSYGYRDLVDLSGFAVHQPLRTAPFDVYVTELRIRVPEHAQWFQLEDCSFEPDRRSLSARMGLRNLLVSGRVKLSGPGPTPGGDPVIGQPPLHFGRINRGSTADALCSMTLRVRRAELGLEASEAGVSPPAVEAAPPPVSPLVRTDAHFVEPDLAAMSVHAYGCRVADPGEPVAQELEDVFLRGMQAVVARAIQRRLQPALRDALMQHLGYSPSYGRR